MRGLAWKILCRAETGNIWAEAELAALISGSGISEVDQRLLRELVFGVIKTRSLLDYQLESLCSKKTPLPARVFLRLGIYQLYCLGKIPPYAAVSATVEEAKIQLNPGSAKLVNAVLRQWLRLGPRALPAAEENPAGYLALRHSVPEFMAARWLARYGWETAQTMLAASGHPPSLVLRVNVCRATRGQVLQELREQGVRAHPGVFPDAIWVEAGAGDPAQLPGFSAGWFYFQDESSQALGYIADPAPGWVCLDYCAAPGGKTTHLAERMQDQGRVWAHDRSAEKYQLIHNNISRLRLRAPKILRRIEPGMLADAVLVDAPCTGLGTLRRHAETRWRVRSGDLNRLAKIQMRLLVQAAAHVKPGGRLVYSTCSTEPEENEQVVRAFLERHRKFYLRPGPGRSGWPSAEFWDADGFFRTFPRKPDWDGIFAARMERSC